MLSTQLYELNLFICVNDSRGGVVADGEHICELASDFADGEVRNLICACLAVTAAERNHTVECEYVAKR